MRDNIVAGIDVGSSKICTLVAEVTPDEDLRVLGVGITPAQGVKKGMVDDIQKATEAIASSVERAERSSGSRIMSAHVSIGGNHTTSLNNRGISTIPGKQRPITEEDIERAMEGAKSLSLPTNREVLHNISRFFIVDGQEHVSDPVGMFGQRLDMDTHIVTGSVTADPEPDAVRRRRRCAGRGARVRAAGRRRGRARGRGEGAGRRTGRHRRRHDEHRRLRRGHASSTRACCPVGGYHLTHDLVAGLRAPFSHVEELKLDLRLRLPSQIDAEETVGPRGVRRPAGEGGAAPARGRDPAGAHRGDPRDDLHRRQAGRLRRHDRRRAGAQRRHRSLPGICELSEMVLRMPVRTGVPRGIHGLADSLNSPAYATSVGLLHWAKTENGYATATNRSESCNAGDRAVRARSRPRASG